MMPALSADGFTATVNCAGFAVDTVPLGGVIVNQANPSLVAAEAWKLTAFKLLVYTRTTRDAGAAPPATPANTNPFGTGSGRGGVAAVSMSRITGIYCGEFSDLPSDIRSRA